jgi:hypothetical protein
VVGEEAEDVDADGGCGEGAVVVMSPRRLCRFYREEEIQETSGDEGYEEAAVVYDDVLSYSTSVVALHST